MYSLPACPIAGCGDYLCEAHAYGTHSACIAAMQDEFDFTLPAADVVYTPEEPSSGLRFFQFWSPLL